MHDESRWSGIRGPKGSRKTETPRGQSAVHARGMLQEPRDKTFAPKNRPTRSQYFQQGKHLNIQLRKSDGEGTRSDGKTRTAKWSSTSVQLGCTLRRVTAAKARVPKGQEPSRAKGHSHVTISGDERGPPRPPGPLAGPGPAVACAAIWYPSQYPAPAGLPEDAIGTADNWERCPLTAAGPSRQE